jgi:hypothetical protein
MKIVLDVLQGVGVSAAAGLRPFLPTLLVGGLASADAGVDFDGTDFAFLESPAFLLLMAAALVLSVLGRRFLEDGPGEAALTGVSLGLGALLFAGTLDDRHDVWWPGIAAGLVCAALSGAVARDIFGRVRARFERSDDAAAATALPMYGELAAVLTAGASVLFPPLALVALGFVVALALRGRGREGRKFAGLRILR